MSQSQPDSSIHFGVDIGGTGIKGAPVDLSTGKLTAERVRIATPQPATPKAVSAVVAEVVKHFAWTGPIGAAFPAAVKGGVAMTAANIDKKWIGTNIEQSIGAATGTEVSAINDADAAGVAELAYGVGKGQDGVVIMTTFGTGIGTALFLHGQLVPNTELGHLEIDGRDAEKHASEIVREKKGLSWAEWAKRVDKYLKHLEALFWPDLIIIGGGASRKADKFIPRLTVRTKVVPAALQNDAGIVGAAVRAIGDVTRPGASANPNPAPVTITTQTPAKAPAPAKVAAKAAKKAAPPVRRAPIKRTPAPAKAVVVAPAKALPVKAPAAKAPVKTPAKAPARKAPAKAPVAVIAKKAPAKRAPVRKAIAKATPAKAAPIKARPAKAAPVKASPAKAVKATPVKARPAKAAAATPAKVAAKAPAKAPARKAPAKAPAKTVAKKAPARKAPAKARPAKAIPVKATPVKATPAKAVGTPTKAPAKKAPAKKAPAKKAPAKTAPAQRGPRRTTPPS